MYKRSLPEHLLFHFPRLFNKNHKILKFQSSTISGTCSSVLLPYVLAINISKQIQYNSFGLIQEHSGLSKLIHVLVEFVFQFVFSSKHISSHRVRFLQVCICHYFTLYVHLPHVQRTTLFSSSISGLKIRFEFERLEA